MRRLAIINQKGGVGKTTTTVNVGVGLARAGHRVLLLDLDPQAHLTLHLGQDPDSGRVGMYELLTGSATISKARRKVGSNLWLVGSSIDLAAAESELVSVVGREVILRDLLDQHAGSSGNGRGPQYDYVLMDCPPSLNLLTLNGLCAVQEVIIPLQPHYLALQGLGKLLETVSLVSKRINPGLWVSGVVVCMNDRGTKLASEVLADIQQFFDQSRGTDVPWSEARVMRTMIRRNIKLAESPSYGQSIFDYAPESNGAEDYEVLAREIHDPAAFDAKAAGAASGDQPNTHDEAKPSGDTSPEPAHTATVESVEGERVGNPKPAANAKPSKEATASFPRDDTSHASTPAHPRLRAADSHRTRTPESSANVSPRESVAPSTHPETVITRSA